MNADEYLKEAESIYDRLMQTTNEDLRTKVFKMWKAFNTGIDILKLEQEKDIKSIYQDIVKIDTDFQEQAFNRLEDLSNKIKSILSEER